MTDRDPAIVNISNQKTGLVLIKSENGVTVTNASPYGVESVFTSDYRNYRLDWYVSMAGAAGGVFLQVYSGTNTPLTTSTYQYQWAGTYVGSGPTYNFAGWATTNPFTGNTALYLGATPYQGYSAHGYVNIYSPQVANVSTRFLGQAINPYTGSYYNANLTGGGNIETTTQYTGFRFYTDAGTQTITYRLYGYRD